MDTEKTPLEDGIRTRLLHRFILLCLIVVTSFAMMVIFIFLMGLLMAPTNSDPNQIPLAGKTFRIVYRQETHPQPESISEKVLESVRNLIGLSKEHKYRRKRGLERENRIHLVDHNQLDKDEESAEARGLGFDELLQRFVRTNRSLKIDYPSMGVDVDRHNGIIRALSNRRKRSTELDGLYKRKRRYAIEYEKLESQYSRCKKATPHEKECDKIYDKLKKLSEEINKNFQEMTNLIKDFKEKDKKKDGDLVHELDDSFPKKKDKKKKKKKDDDSKESDEKEERKTYKKDKPVLDVEGTTESLASSSTLPKTNETTELDEAMASDSTSQPPSTTSTLSVGTTEHSEENATVAYDTASTSTLISTTDSHSDHGESTDHSLDELIKAMRLAEQKGTTTRGPYEPASHRPVTKECVTNLDELLQTVDEFKSVNTTKKNCTKTTTEPTYLPSDLRNLHQQPPKDQEQGMQTDDMFSSHIGQPSLPIHEDLAGEAQAVHEFVMDRSRNRFQHNHDRSSTEELPQSIIDPPNVQMSNPVSPTIAGDAFLKLCDQVRSQNQQDPIRTLTSYRNNFQAQQYGGLGHTSIPASGETLKASSQMMFNSAYAGYVPNHFCIYQIPPAYGVVRPVYPGGGQTHPGGIINVPVSIQNLPVRRNMGEPDTQNAQLICSIVQQSTPPTNTNLPVEPVTESIKDSALRTTVLLDTSTDPTAQNESDHSDLFRARGHLRRHCVRGWIPCANGQQCIRSSEWCDSKTHCLDGSDERHCSCLTRLSKKRFCDGYIDCPFGEDEMGCFGCDKFSFSCFNSEDEHGQAHKSGPMCYTTIEKCDGFDNCLNRKDELDCTMLVKDLGSPLAFAVGYSAGILHRNHKGKWFPVCDNPITLAREACEHELGPLDHEPLITQRQGHLTGPFIQQSPHSQHVFQPEFTDTCNGMFNYVKCPVPKCGTSKLNEFPSARIKIRNKRNVTDDENVESVRIVGGVDAEAGAFPFIVAIFRDGKFHCGGSIFNEHWIISAAHCCDNFQNHYYELRAGLLRKKSFAPQVQVAKVTHIIVHHGYSATKMINDISLMRTERPFHYNRWVRPICLPSKHRTTGDRDWMWGPKAGHQCTVTGWGALRERGGIPDHLKEVSVPILSYCKHKNDREGMEICAATDGGGFDACQGDSGGPFICPSHSDPHEWYLAGVVSHGEGCARANEPGVYTRVALFIDWIRSKTHDPLPAVTTSLSCPGFHCSWGAPFCLPASKRCNGHVECLGGEDESDCPMDSLLGVMMDAVANETATGNNSSLKVADATATSTSTIPIDIIPTVATVVSTISSTSVSSREISTKAAVNGSREADANSEVEIVGSAKLSSFADSVSSTTMSQSTLETLHTVSEEPTTSPSTVSQSTVRVETVTKCSTKVRNTTEALSTVSEEPISSATTIATTSSEPIWTLANKTMSEVKHFFTDHFRSGTNDTGLNHTADALGDDMEHGASNVHLATEPAHEHPFFRELVDMEDTKQKTLNRFRIATHNLHTSLSNRSELTLNETSRYRRFVCKKIHQTINVAHHCDRVIDCEDGTDEMSCTCRDYLRDKYNFLICDGKTDCWDLTDELNCLQCGAGKYPCRMSNVCIDEKQLCDSHPDCPLHEDELDCLALTDGHKIYFDANNLSMFKYEGLVTRNTRGTWNVVCDVEVTNRTADSVGKICSFLGFAGYRNYSQITLEPHQSDPTTDSSFLVQQASFIKSYRNISAKANCNALHVICVPYINATQQEISHFANENKQKPVQVNIKPLNPIDRPHLQPHITFHENAHIQLIENFGDDYDWPWHTDVYLDGRVLCRAIIVDANWIIVDSSCMRLINLKIDYISVVAGGAKSYLKIAGPYEQVLRVDCYHYIPDARVVLLHLEKQLSFTRHVLPTFIPEKNHTIEENQCLAVGQDKLGRTRTVGVHLNMTGCRPAMHVCYQLNSEHGFYEADHCDSEVATRSGVVVCKTPLSGWYPVGFFRNKRGLCGFNKPVEMISLKAFYPEIQHVLSHQKCDYDFVAPVCTGMRCRYGKCVEKLHVCDGKQDCLDGADENPTMCATMNQNQTAGFCLTEEFRCANGRCMDKSKFCDGRNDCGDLSDEPNECSCYTYYKATNPTKICDGVRNCWDKSDENPRLCKCQETNFRCGESGACVPHDHVCDGDNDCPGGEDERYCYALQQNPEQSNYGEVMQQSFGIWHSKCFPKDVKYDDENIRQICESIGYHRTAKIYGRKMQHGDATGRMANSSTDDPVEKTRSVPTKAVVLNKFSKVVINPKQSFFMKPSRPMFKLVNWSYEDEMNCDRLEINCGD
ncbi:serine protease nudel isoform X2 [Toxorhynchites rutilus septentrionalis]|uniref:serine protease nudel isoform X2 n=1 Tax=Toxorhynchites rutilus septentrionalis TaxID=329112 RepID=UPI00247AEC5F|nr:serine protease nudel isoform X2 [Toxorhynchites rutilus septentrionalis]